MSPEADSAIWIPKFITLPIQTTYNSPALAQKGSKDDGADDLPGTEAWTGGAWFALDGTDWFAVFDLILAAQLIGAFDCWTGTGFSSSWTGSEFETSGTGTETGSETGSGSSKTGF